MFSFEHLMLHCNNANALQTRLDIDALKFGGFK